MSRILVVDDKETMCTLFQRILSGHEVVTASDGSQALALLAAGENFEVIISDIRMAKVDGLTLLKEVKHLLPEVEIILMTAYAEVETAVYAMKLGAFDYLVKPFEPDDVLLVVEKALNAYSLNAQAKNQKRQLNQRKTYGSFVGESPEIQKVYFLIEKAGVSHVNVLITGESGTGKELVAQSIHENGTRQKGSFVVVNCGALPVELAESELFGHVKGAFTGASVDKAGLVEEAHKGTLFLDEVNSLPFNIQVKLNRLIEAGEGRRVGANKTYQVDVRLIAATNVELQEEVTAGRFREDLYFRLDVLRIPLPALRERKEDIPLLATHFLKTAKTAKTEKKIQNFEPEVLKAFLAYHWPGNIRELRNFIEAAIVIADENWITLKDLPPQILKLPPKDIPVEHLALLSYQDVLSLAKDQMLKQYLMALMKTYRGNVTSAAGRAEVERETLHRLLKKHGIKPATFRN